jgi:hypothetical protein
MAARPPSDDIDDEPNTVEFGIAALEARIDNRDVSFPVTADALAAAYGDMEVAVDPGGNTVALAVALEQCDRETFDSKQDLLNALHPVFEREREALSGGIVGRLRALVPF